MLQALQLPRARASRLTDRDIQRASTVHPREYLAGALLGRPNPASYRHQPCLPGLQSAVSRLHRVEKSDAAAAGVAHLNTKANWLTAPNLGFRHGGGCQRSNCSSLYRLSPPDRALEPPTGVRARGSPKLAGGDASEIRWTIT